MRGIRVVLAIIASCGVISGFFETVYADRYSSASYVIDASVMSNAGGAQSSTSYNLTSSAGENVIGNGSAGSYKIGMGYVAQLDKSLTLTVQPSGLVGYWPFNEPSGSFAYDTSSNDQTLSSVTQTFGTGKISTALQFDASTAAASTTTSSALDFQSSDFSISFWYNPSVVTGSRDILRKGTLSSNGYEVALVGAAPILYVSAVGNYRYCSAISASVWTQITFVKQGTTLDCYLNGVLANGLLGGSIPANIGTTAAQMTVGGVGFFNVGPAGLIDELKMFNIALPSHAVKAEYDATSSGVPAGLSLGTIIPGTSNTVLADIVTQTDAGGYTLAINQDHDLMSGSYTIPAIAGSIASPTIWTEGTTKGLGFTLTATNATAISGIWNAGNSYAAFPVAATTFYTRTGMPSSKDYLTLRLRTDVPLTQVASPTPYTNMLTVTGTMTP